MTIRQSDNQYDNQSKCLRKHKNKIEILIRKLVNYIRNMSWKRLKIVKEKKIHSIVLGNVGEKGQILSSVLCLQM